MNGRIGKLIVGVLILIGLLVFLPFIGSIWQHVNADESVVCQRPSGELLVWDQPTSFAPQYFGTCTHYKKSFQAWFSNKADQGKAVDESIKCRFNEGGHAQISGGVRVTMPTSPEKLKLLHTQFGSQKAVEHELIHQAIERAIYMSGPLMSSQESSAEKRPLLLQYIEDQAANGVYSTVVKETKQTDPITGELKTVSIVEILRDKAGLPVRLEESPLAKYGITMTGLTINEVRYDGVVEDQINQQQKAKMQVQIAIAQAKRAEQDALTSAKEGEASAMKAKWEQEVKKTAEVVTAEKEAAVAKIAAEKEAAVMIIGAERDLKAAELATKTAEQKKLAQIALGEGESKRMQLVMAANGALEQRLQAWVTVNEKWATAFSGYKGNAVPQIVTGGGGKEGGSSVTDFIDLIKVKTMRDLSIDMAMTPSSNQTAAPQH